MPTEAPPAAPQQAAAPAQQSLMDAIQAQNAPPAAAPQQQAVQPKAPEKPAAPAKPEAAATPPAKPAAKGKGLDALPTVGGEESAKPEGEKPTDAQPTPEDTPPAGLKPEAQIEWGKLRKIAKEHEAIKPQFETLKKQLEELKAKPVIPEDLTKELEDHRQFRAAYDVQNTPEFKAAVSEPMAQQWEAVNMVVEFLQVDSSKLEKAMAEPNKLRRNELIKAALSESEKEVDATTVMEVANAATEMHKLHAKGQELQAKAMEFRNVLNGRKEQETQAQKQEREALFEKASEETARAMETKLGEFFKDEELAKEIKAARPAEDPMDQAYQAKAGVILPSIVRALNDARTKLKEYEAREKARRNANPSDNGGDSRTPEQKPDDQGLSLKEAVAMQFGPRM